MGKSLSLWRLYYLLGEKNGIIIEFDEIYYLWWAKNGIIIEFDKIYYLWWAKNGVIIEFGEYGYKATSLSGDVVVDPLSRCVIDCPTRSL